MIFELFDLHFDAYAVPFQLVIRGKAPKYNERLQEENMKKSFLAIILAVVLCISLIAVVACDEKEPDPKPTPSVNVPTEEGKITFYFTLGDSSATIPSYASVYMTGAAVSGYGADWATGLNALEFKNLEGTKVYYAIFGEATIDTTQEKACEYQLVLGYNKSSTLPDDKCGLAWVDSYKSDVCAALGGLNNPSFTYNAGDQVIDLGTHSFETEIPAPVRINTTLVVKFAEALPAGYSVAIPGGFNGWDSSKAFATISADRKSASLELKDVLAAKCEYKIKVFPNYEEGKFWNDESNVPYGIEIAGYEGGNLSVELGRADNNTECILNDSFPVIGYEIVLPAADAEDQHHVYIYAEVYTLKIKFSAPVTRDYVCIKGSFNWDSWYDMTANADKTEYTWVFSGDPGSYEFLVCVCDQSLNGGDQYDLKIAGTGEIGAQNNATITIVKGTTEYDLFAEVIVLPAA